MAEKLEITGRAVGGGAWHQLLRALLRSLRPCRQTLKSRRRGRHARGFVFGLGGLLVAVAPALFAKKKSVAVVARQRSRLVTFAALAYLCVDMCCAMCLDMCLDMLGNMLVAPGRSCAPLHRLAEAPHIRFRPCG